MRNPAAEKNATRTVHDEESCAAIVVVVFLFLSFSLFATTKKASLRFANDDDHTNEEDLMECKKKTTSHYIKGKKYA